MSNNHTNHKEHTMNATDRNTETSEETFAEWAAMQPIRARWMDEFCARELGGDESCMIRVTRRVTFFGTFTEGMEAI
jgi:hypothetical protein